MKYFKDVLSDLNNEPIPDEKNLKAFHGSTMVRNFHQGIFRTRDGKRYAVNAKGEIRRTDRVKFPDWIDERLTKQQ